jgi:7-keto-8-aminopelargonate synthetase-like enzyme
MAPVEPGHHQGVPAHATRRSARDRERSFRERRRALITDGVFSMDGDLGALPELCDVADEFGCIMMVDDAHASGVFGRTGAARSIISGCTVGSTSRSARCRRPSARSAVRRRIAR